jgi:hypothetical protein
MDEQPRTLVDKKALERYSAELPECRRFLQNFFGTCGGQEYEHALANYRMDLQLYSADRSYIRQNRRRLEKAFFDIAKRPEAVREGPESGLIGGVAGYSILTKGDRVTVAGENGKKAEESVRGLGKFIQEHQGRIKLGWGRTADFDIIYLYSREDGFGYAVNLDDPILSEWGYAPFEPTSE